MIRLLLLWATVDGTTPLHFAVHNDNLEEAAKLIRAGADAKAANRYGVTPLVLACTNGNGAMVELLLESGADPNATMPGKDRKSTRLNSSHRT